MAGEANNPYVSRGGLKLRGALDHFKLDVTGLRCADLGCSTGGFTDCLLQAGAQSVVSMDTGYGVLAWKLRQDPRVKVRERSNALHTDPGPDAPVDLVVIDMSWTPQRLCVPAALRWLAPSGRILTLIKPHYELEADEKRTHLRAGVLEDSYAELVAQRVSERMNQWGAECLGMVKADVRGGSGGNQEYLALLKHLSKHP
jgi:23S rRNA (cytidine1920-2'-O)/16S rRNA (cytidine1409-2'-O)-methyltransferase